MELVDGETLADRIRRDGAVPLAELVELMLPIVSGVANLHAAGILHRDLKPANILLARDSSGHICPKIADFGVSRFSEGSTGDTNSGLVLGTYAYMPPEQMGAGADPTEHVDQYALAVTLYESATGSRPFAGATTLALINAVMHDTIVPPSARNHLLPRAFDDVVLRAMSRDPRARYMCVDELGEALLPFAEPRVEARWASEFQAQGLRGLRPRTTARSGLRALAAGASVAAIASAAWAMHSEPNVHAPKASAPAERMAPAVSYAPPALTAPEIPSSALPAAAAATVLSAALPAATVPAGDSHDRKALAPKAVRPTPHPPSRRAYEVSDNGAPILDPE
jgi:serine/threonine-protein kinase